MTKTLLQPRARSPALCLHKPPDADPSFAAVNLDPSSIRCGAIEPGLLRVTIAGDHQYDDVVPIRCFPHSDPDHHIALVRATDDHGPIGVIIDPGQLDQESRAVLRSALDRRYFCPEILRITRMKEKRGAAYFQVLTNHGERRFTVEGIRENVIEVREGEFLITDQDGLRYRIPDWTRMDRKSRRILELFV